MTITIGKEIILGIRPEDMSDSKFTHMIKFPQKADCLLEVVEPMGNEFFLYLNTGKHNLVARMSEKDSLNLGCKTDIIFKMEKALFFDQETNQRI